MKVIYINYVDLDKVTSGSSVRPMRMYKAFEELNYDVTMLTGLQNQFLDRWKKCFKLFKEIRKKDYDFCYVESPSGPIFNFCDHLILLYISKIKKIPVGFFYRDAYWKFGNWYSINKVKKAILKFMHKFDLFLLDKVCDKIYFPSETMADLFELKNKDSLPPGSNSKTINKEIKAYEEKKVCIYVGGVSDRYGTNILLEAFEKINKEADEVKLILICREKIDIIKKYENCSWLQLELDVSGEEKLKPFYEKADLAVIPFKRDVYMDFAIPIKLFEYISNSIPIVATNCVEVEKIINKYNLGIVTDENSSALAEGIKEFYEKTEEERNALITNSIICEKENTWASRIIKVKNDLVK